jgi:hypothetical protein
MFPRQTKRTKTGPGVVEFEVAMLSAIVGSSAVLVAVALCSGRRITVVGANSPVVERQAAPAGFPRLDRQAQHILKL